MSGEEGASKVRPALVFAATGTGPVVVCLHGQPGSSTDWFSVAELLRADFSVVAVDRLGYGRTGGEAAGFGVNATAVIATLDELGVDRAIMVGHSWAGGVALALAADHPDRVGGLVLVSSIGPVAGAGWVDRILAAPVVGDVMVASTFAMARTLLGSAAIRAGVDRVLPGASRSALAPAANESLWRSFMVEQRAYVDEIDDLEPGLARISTPTVVLAGMSDHVVTPDVGARLASSIPGAVLRQVAGAGHLLPFDHPSVVADAVRAVAASPPPGLAGRHRPGGPPSPTARLPEHRLSGGQRTSGPPWPQPGCGPS
ncbi:MAG: alpha/beta hydrolase [Actinomycetota bacterium]|nr:alpha/beta hydrolase [Actinomycetota bacterium]